MWYGSKLSKYNPVYLNKKTEQNYQALTPYEFFWIYLLDYNVNCVK